MRASRYLNDAREGAAVRRAGCSVQRCPWRDLRLRRRGESWTVRAGAEKACERAETRNARVRTSAKRPARDRETGVGEGIQHVASERRRGGDGERGDDGHGIGEGTIHVWSTALEAKRRGHGAEAGAESKGESFRRREAGRAERGQRRRRCASAGPCGAASETRGQGPRRRRSSDSSRRRRSIATTPGNIFLAMVSTRHPKPRPRLATRPRIPRFPDSKGASSRAWTSGVAGGSKVIEIQRRRGHDSPWSKHRHYRRRV